MAKAETVEKSYIDFEAKTAGKDNLWKEYPEKIVLIEDPSHPLYDERVALPLREPTVLDIMQRGVLIPVLCRRAKGGSFEVVDGRQRVRHAIEANRRLVEAGHPPRQIPIKITQARDNEVFGNLVAANAHRTNDSHSAKARNIARFLDLGHTEEDARITFNLKSENAVKSYIALAAASPALLTALDEGRIGVTAAVRLAKKFSPEEQEQALIQAEMSEPAFGDEQTTPVGQIPEGARADVRASVARLVNGAKTLDGTSSGKTKQKRQPRQPTGPKKIKTKDVDAITGTASSRPSAKQVKDMIALLEEYDGYGSMNRNVLQALKYGLEYSLKGDKSLQPACIEELLSAIAVEQQKLREKVG